MKDFSLSHLELGILILLVTVVILQLITWLTTYGKIKFSQESQTKKTNYPPVSVLICARNEGDNLTEFLPKILLQNYPAPFEVVVVNDCSWDNTSDVLREYGKEFENLKIITIKEDEHYKHGKKFAIMVGIKGTQYEHLLLTDADCYPSSEYWITEVMNCYSEDTEIVLGYGAYQREKGFLNKLIRFDTFQIGVNYISASLKKKAYMGVGRNLSYQKNVFFKIKGFSSHYHIPSGDDDLLVNQAANSKNVAVSLHTDSFTYSIPKRNFADWAKQKARHLMTSELYHSDSKKGLIYSHSLPYIFWLVFVSSLFFPKILIISLSLVLIRLLAQSILFFKAMKAMGEKDLLFYLIIFELILLFCYPYFHVRRLFSKINKWKN